MTHASGRSTPTLCGASGHVARDCDFKAVDCPTCRADLTEEVRAMEPLLADECARLWWPGERGA